MARFSYTGSERRRIPRSISLLLQLALWALIIGLFLYGIRTFSAYTREKQRESLDYALKRDIAECYALEGIYPPDIDYLREHYGLTYDENLFYVDYRTLGSNLYPDVTVLELKP